MEGKPGSVERLARISPRDETDATDNRDRVGGLDDDRDGAGGMSPSGERICDCAWSTLGRVMMPPPTAGTVSYSSTSSISDGDCTLKPGSEMKSSQGATENDVVFSSSSASLDSSVSSASPLFGEKRLRKFLNMLFAGSPSGRRPYVGSKCSMSGNEEGTSSWGGEEDFDWVTEMEGADLRLAVRAAALNDVRVEPARGRPVSPPDTDAAR